MKKRWRFFRRFPVVHIRFVHILKEHYCVFQQVFQMTKCSLIDCELLIPKRLEESGAELCSAFIILVVSTPSIFTRNVPFPVNKPLKRCSPMPLADNYRYG